MAELGGRAFNGRRDHRGEILKIEFASCYAHDRLKRLVLMETHGSVVDPKKMQGGHEGGSLVGVEKRVIPHNEETIRGSFFDERRETIDAKDESLRLGKAGLQQALIANALHSPVSPDQVVVESDQLVPREVNRVTRHI